MIDPRSSTGDVVPSNGEKCCSVAHRNVLSSLIINLQAVGNSMLTTSFSFFLFLILRTSPIHCSPSCSSGLPNSCPLIHLGENILYFFSSLSSSSLWNIVLGLEYPWRTASQEKARALPGDGPHVRECRSNRPIHQLP